MVKPPAEPINKGHGSLNSVDGMPQPHARPAPGGMTKIREAPAAYADQGFEVQSSPKGSPA